MNSDDASETSDTTFHIDGADNVVTSIVEDHTDEDRLLSDTSSLSSLVPRDGHPEIKPRPYQLEMFEESLKRNIIVAVCHPSPLTG